MSELELLAFNFDLRVALYKAKGYEGDIKVHLYVSNNVSTDYNIVLLDKSSQIKTTSIDSSTIAGVAESATWPIRNLHFRLRKEYKSKEKAHKIPRRCNLNGDFFTRIKNDCGEDCWQKAGSFRINLLQLVLKANDDTSSFDNHSQPLFHGDIDIPYIRDFRKKGEVILTNTKEANLLFCAVDTKLKSRLQEKHFEELTKVTVTAVRSSYERMQAFMESIMNLGGSSDGSNGQTLKERILSIDGDVHAFREHQKEVMKKYIDACVRHFELIPPTLPSLAKVNSDTWESRCGPIPSIFFTTDPTEPVVEEIYYSNALDIVLGRMGMKRSDIDKMSIDDAKDLAVLASMIAQVLSLYVVHCIYRGDFVYVRDNLTGKMKKCNTEDFGDVLVDEGASDCEDFGKNILRHANVFSKHKFANDAQLRKLQKVLACYYWSLVLLGVSSKQINDAPEDIKEMGAHMNAFLIPKQDAYDMMAKLYPERFEAWKREVWANGGDVERESWTRSLKCPVLVIEGTGFQKPISEREPSKDIRVTLEHLMDKDTFFAARRWFYFVSGEDSSFYKTIQKVFFPQFLQMGYSFGTFNVCQLQRAGGITRGVSFSSFTAKKMDEMCLIMDPELDLDEKVCAREYMNDVHPVPALQAARLQEGTYSETDALMNRLSAMLDKVTSLGQRSSHHEFPWERFPDAKPMTYFLRRSDIKSDIVTKFAHIFSEKLPIGTLYTFKIIGEYVSTAVGGYRIELILDSKNILIVLERLKEAERAKRLMEQQQQQKTQGWSV